ncbi:trimethyllysine dioxygenase, mitochondrial [Panthera uncia]|uniref:trimethyllysine dioxygenase, mitochondrial n=1 Tax=Panthera uncia TaxID=29064 RepID=UPI0020FF9451|nr:trimethyllysine dioxygenase, mitochondrial [Panthera uncia]
MWCCRLSHLHGRLQNLLSRGVTCSAFQQPNFKSLFPLAIRWHHTASKSLNCAWQQHEDHFGKIYGDRYFIFFKFYFHSSQLTYSVILVSGVELIRHFHTTPGAHDNFSKILICSLFSTEQKTLIFSLFSIQVFHCLKHEGTGGRTLLVDGFYAADQVLQKAPEEFELLTKVPLRHEYIENVGECHNHMIGVGPVLNTYPWNKELYLIRYNNYDRAVINTVPYDVVHRWYTAHRTLTVELRRPENEFWVKLKPGRVLFIDNWRVLHGRESFTGYRQLCGCYLTRDDVLNTARLLGLQA